MKKIASLLGLVMLAGVAEVNAQCWVDKKEGYNYVTVGRIRANSNEDCYTREAIGAAGYLLLLDE